MADKNQSSGVLSIIGAGTIVNGSIKSEGSIRIDGKIVGNVATVSDAAVGITGIVEGTVDARNITIAGKVLGTLNAAQKLVLEGKSVLKGDLRTARLVIDEGAVFDGKSSMSVPPPQQSAR
jgi:cytoskeletal protein CcmA (bactofilin family)